MNTKRGRLSQKMKFILRAVLGGIVLLVCLHNPLYAQVVNFQTEKGIPVHPVRAIAPDPAIKGMIYINSTDNKFYWYDGTQWVAFGSSLSMKPSVTNVGISGTLYVGSTVSGTYTYLSDEASGSDEGDSEFQWYQADDATGTNKAAISGATGTCTSGTASTATAYTIGSLAGKYLAFGLTPVSSLPATGTEVLSSWQYIYAGGVTASVSLTSNSALYKGQTLNPVPTFTPATLGTCNQTANATYTWYRNSSASKTGATTIGSGTGTSPTYTVLNTDETQYIGLEVIPDASCNAATTAGIDWKQVIALTPAYADVTLSGLTSSKAKTGTTITAVKGTYSTTPTNLTASEGTPTYQWYWATDASGTGKTAIAGQTASTHAVDKTLYGYTDGSFLAVGITPKTLSNETGTEVLSSWVEVYTNSAPVASNIIITGTYVNGATLSVTFTYTDADGDAVGIHTYKWYRADDASGTNGVAISGATTTSYLLTATDAEKFVRVGVTPVATAGTSSGTEVFSTWTYVDPWTCGTSTVTFTYNGSSVTYGTIETTIAGGVKKCWLDRNLGAAGLPASPASNTDATAFGDLFQWCRAADGHQIRTSTTYSGPVANSTNSTSNAWYGKFVISGSNPWDWLSSQLPNGNLWWNGSAAGANNPCPTGFHVPTLADV